MEIDYFQSWKFSGKSSSVGNARQNNDAGKKTVRVSLNNYQQPSFQSKIYCKIWFQSCNKTVLSIVTGKETHRQNLHR